MSIGDDEVARALRSLQQQFDNLEAIVRALQSKVADYGTALKAKGII